MKSFITAVALAVALSAGSVVDSVDVGGSGWFDLEVNLNEANARGRGGHRGGSGPRRSAHTSTHRTTHTRTSRSSKSVNVNKNVNVNVDHRHRRRAPVGAAVAGALVVGAIVSTLPPSCRTLIVDGISYHRCDGVYYEPSYRGTDVVYVVVDDP